MAKLTDKRILRILDANANRAREGLRVCEDVCRFVGNRRLLTRRLKTCRHDLTSALGRLSRRALLDARDVHGDTGRTTLPAERRRQGINDIFRANAQRVKEAVRVLEEITKLSDGILAERLKRLRYRMYTIEKDYDSAGK